MKAIRNLILILFLVSSVLNSRLRKSKSLKKKSLTKTVPPNEWMKYVPDGRLFNEMSIPGTHCSGAVLSKTAVDKNQLTPGDTSFYSTVSQKLFIPEQLENGIRLLQLSLKANDTCSCELFLSHFNEELFYLNGGKPEYLTIKVVVSQVQAFLKSHPSEFVVLDVGYEGDSELYQTCFRRFLFNSLDNYKLENGQKLFCSSGSFNAIKDFRGKIVLLLRDEISANAYQDMYGSPDAVTYFYTEDLKKRNMYESHNDYRFNNVVGYLNGAQKNNYLMAYDLGMNEKVSSFNAADMNKALREYSWKKKSYGLVYVEYVQQYQNSKKYYEFPPYLIYKTNTFNDETQGVSVISNIWFARIAKGGDKAVAMEDTLSMLSAKQMYALPEDINESKGDVIRLGFEISGIFGEGIRGITAKTDTKECSDNGWTWYPITSDFEPGKSLDVTKGTGAKRDTFLFMTYDTRAGNPFSEIYVYVGQQQTESYLRNINGGGWEVVKFDYSGEIADLKRDTGGHYMYLLFRRQKS